MKRYCVECCSECDKEIELKWDPEKDGYKVFCPNCGKVLMLCDECLHSDGPGCDYCSETDTCHRNPPVGSKAKARKELT